MHAGGRGVVTIGGGCVTLPPTRQETFVTQDTTNDAADLVTAGSMIDRALRALCPHDPGTWQTAPDPAGELLTTCPACGVWRELVREGGRRMSIYAVPRGAVAPMNEST